MANTPKSERQFDKAAAASDRHTKSSYANHRDDGHPSHKRQAAAIDREHGKREHFDREYLRNARRS